jgi:hypothetical protein
MICIPIGSCGNKLNLINAQLTDASGNIAQAAKGNSIAVD